MADNKRVLRQTITIQSNKDFNYKMSGYYVVIQEQYTCNVFQKKWRYNYHKWRFITVDIYFL